MPLGLLAGLALTWVRQGLPLYARLALWAAFQARRRLAAPTLAVQSRAYYRAPAATDRAFAVPGRVRYHGPPPDPGAPDPGRSDAWPPAPAPASGPAGRAAGAGSAPAAEAGA